MSRSAIASLVALVVSSCSPIVVQRYERTPPVVGMEEPAAGQGRALERIDFEELGAGCEVREVGTDKGHGPIRVRGLSPVARQAGANVAVVIDTARHLDLDPDPDLLTNPRQRHALIVSTRTPDPKTHRVKAPVNDQPTPRGRLRFDFSQVGPVTFYGLTLIDNDDGRMRIRLFEKGGGHLDGRRAEGSKLEGLLGDEYFGIDVLGDTTDSVERRGSGDVVLRVEAESARSGPSPRVRLYRSPVVEIEVEKSGEDGSIQKLDLRKLTGTGGASSQATWFRELGVPNVERLEIEMGGSGAVDDILFRLPEVLPTDPKTYLEERLKKCAMSAKPGFLSPYLRELEQDMQGPRLEDDQEIDAWLEDAHAWLKKKTALIDRVEAGVMEELDAPTIHCGCPEFGGLRAWVVREFADAHDKLSALRRELIEIEKLRRSALEPVAVLASAGPAWPDSVIAAIAETQRKKPPMAKGLRERLRRWKASAWDIAGDVTASLGDVLSASAQFLSQAKALLGDPELRVEIVAASRELIIRLGATVRRCSLVEPECEALLSR